MAIGTTRRSAILQKPTGRCGVLTVPWDERHCNTDWLLDGEDTSLRDLRVLDGAETPLSLTSEPPREAQRIVEFTLRLE